MIEQFKLCAQGVEFRVKDMLVRVDVYSGSIFRVVCTGNESFAPDRSLVVTMPRPESAAFEVEELSGCVRVRTASLMCDISRKTGAFTWRDGQGNLLTKEPAKGGKTLNRVDVVKTDFNADAEVRLEDNVDGVKARAEGVRRVDRQAWQTKLEFVWKPDEALYGLGSHEEGVFNLRGTMQYLYQENMKATVPVLLSTEGYGVLMDCCSLMTFHDDLFGSYLWADVEDQMDYYFIAGPNYDAVLKGLRALTGKAPMLPMAALGYVQSKERYKTADELIEIAEEYRRRHLPLDVIVLDWQSWPGNQWGQKTFDPARFPDPEAMTRRLHELNVKMMISIWPNMSEGGANHAEMLERGFLLGNRSTYDAFNPDARALYWKQANEGLFSRGVDAWWCDCSEPFEADWKGKVKPEPEERLNINVSESKKYLDPEFINAYSLLHSQGIYEGQRKASSDKRVLNLTRSCYAGQHRYATITWSGDISANWDTLEKQVPAALNFCVTGEPYWTTDIGAFFVSSGGSLHNPKFPIPWFMSGEYDKGCEDLGYRELFTRWFQFAAFLPMFRAHGTGTPREVWRFGEPGTMFYDALEKMLRLRYRLMPYIYSLAGQVTHQDGTILRVPALEFADKALRNVKDQMLFGPSLLACPVTRPMYFNAGSEPIEDASITRSVYLPAGCAWFDFWTGERLEGGQAIEAACPIDIIPLYVKAGAVLPFGPDIEYAGQETGEPLEIRVYPGADGSFALYQDEGDNYNYEQGKFAWINLSWDDRKNTLTIGAREGSFPGMKQTQPLLIRRMGGAEKTVAVQYTGSIIKVEL